MHSLSNSGSSFAMRGPGGTFDKQEQWERWRAKRILMYGSKYRGACKGPAVSPPEKMRMYVQNPAI